MDPTVAEYFPAAHGVHVFDAFTNEYVPAAQVVQTEAPVTEDLPEAHCVQKAIPGVEE